MSTDNEPMEGDDGMDDDPAIDVAEEADDDEGEEAEIVLNIATNQRKKRNRRGGRNKKKKTNFPDPHTSSSKDVFAAVGMVDIDLDYEQDEFQRITNLKSFSNLIKPVILLSNPGANVSKMYPLFQVKYKEFLDHMAAHGKPVQKQRAVRTYLPPQPVQSGPLIKTRSSTRRNGRRGADGSEGNTQDSDQEFEAMIKNHENQQDNLEREKEEQRVSRAAAKVDKKKAALESARAWKRARMARGEEEEVHQDYCEICQEAGDVILCDTCPRVYHCTCIDENMEKPSEGDWSCAHCEEHGPEFVAIRAEPTKQNMDYCRICKETGNILLCDQCPNSFHAYCIDPPLTEVPDSAWACPRCTLVQPPQRIEKILSWRWKDIRYPEPLKIEDGVTPSRIEALLRPSRKMEDRREREFFVKFKHLSYWQCRWLSETMMDVFFNVLTRMYWRKVDPEIPPQFDESTLSRHHSDNDPYQLREKFYQHGVKPEWMQIQRVISHLSYESDQQDYLVKWKELSYEQATWERDDVDMTYYQDAIIKYWAHRERILNDRAPVNVVQMITRQREARGLPAKEEMTSSRKSSRREKYDIKKKWEEQPDYITETGGKLHPYQLEGINWLRRSWSNGTDAILADEMGLGKTVQSLTFLYSLMKENHSQGPFLIAAPLSTIINWEREAEQWCPDFYVVTYVGDRDSRSVIREHEFSFDEKAVRPGAKASKMRSQENMKFHVLLTSYECINSDKAMLSSIDWAALVVDEAHRLKNNQSSFFKNLQEYNIQYRVLLTGTPLQNNLEELFHLLNFLAPDRFNQLEQFTGEFSEISKEDQIGKLHALLGPHMLRRLKADVLTGMPTKSELIVRVELSSMQKKYYKNILTRNFDALNVKNGGTQMSLINILMELKKCCNHPYLFAKASIEAPKLENGMFEGTALIKNAGKFVLLQKMLRKLKDGGHRVLIFSQMTMMLDIMEDFCDIEGYKYERIDGSITGQQRQDAIDRYNAPGAQQFVFLLSTRAGGLGINLATADTVIIYDSDWNPHNDIQAFSRAHRLGQKQKVMIYRFVTKGSVEERITSVAKKKMLLTHLVVRAGLGGKEGKSMSKSELDDVLRWGTEELFKEEEPAAEGAEGESGKKTNEQEIVWNDEAVDFLLDRNKDEEAPEGEKKEHWTNEYLSSFKVATYITKEADEQPDEETALEIIKEGDSKEVDPDYWEKLLKHHYEQDQVVEAQKLGKGKRVRRQINYASENMVQDWNNHNRNQHEEDEDDTSDESGAEEQPHSDDDYDEKKRRRREDPNEKLPPLLAKYIGYHEVLGFSTRQRKAFYNAVMRWGTPPTENFRRTKWLVRDLKGKTDEHFQAYASLFMRHLCEPGADNTEKYSDGVPREGVNRANILCRIGLLNLIHKKVGEFKRHNGEWSMPEVRDQSYYSGSAGLNEASTSKYVPEIQIDSSLPVTSGPLTCAMVPRVKRPRPKFKFNIVDGEFTELHALWENEEKVAREGKEYEIWHRRHDYWLLTAISVYGYGRWAINFADISNDPRFAIINEPFKIASAPVDVNIHDVKVRFLQRRFKLLETALSLEEQLRRFSYLSTFATLPPDNIGPMAQRYTDLENIANSNVFLAKESRNNRDVNLVFLKTLATLDNLLNELKGDIVKLPATLGHVRPVTERLHMTERQILSRLTMKDVDPRLTRPPLPPSGPFVIPMLNQHLPTIQPRFASLQYDDEEIAEKLSEKDGDAAANLLASIEAAIAEKQQEAAVDNVDDKDIPSTSSAHQPEPIGYDDEDDEEKMEV